MVVCQTISATRHCARDGSLLYDTVFNPHEHLWGGADQRFITIIDVELIRRGVDLAETPIELERAAVVAPLKTVGEYDLKKFSETHLFPRVIHCDHERLASGIGEQFMGNPQWRTGRQWGLRGGQRCQALTQQLMG